MKDCVGPDSEEGAEILGVETSERVLSGIQPSSTPHIGNYYGALRQWVEVSNRAESAFFMVADMHVLTTRHDPAELRRNRLVTAAVLVGCGLDLMRSHLFIQSLVPAHAVAQWLLSSVTGLGELRRMTHFKEKAPADQASSRLALFAYPVLQAADILLYRATHVPVGEDQRQHLELSRDLANRFNSNYGEVFTVPQAAFTGVGARIMDLSRPTRKMSKTGVASSGTVSLMDPDEVIRRRIMRATTDAGGGVFRSEEKPGITALIELMAAATRQEPAVVESDYCSWGYGKFKTAVADAVIADLGPIRSRIDQALADRGELARILREGSEIARTTAAATLDEAMVAVGLGAFDDV